MINDTHNTTIQPIYVKASDLILKIALSIIIYVTVTKDPWKLKAFVSIRCAPQSIARPNSWCPRSSISGSCDAFTAV